MGMSGGGNAKGGAGATQPQGAPVSTSNKPFVPKPPVAPAKSTQQAMLQAQQNRAAPSGISSLKGGAGNQVHQQQAQQQAYMNAQSARDAMVPTTGVSAGVGQSYETNPTYNQQPWQQSGYNPADFAAGGAKSGALEVGGAAPMAPTPLPDPQREPGTGTMPSGAPVPPPPSLNYGNMNRFQQQSNNMLRRGGGGKGNKGAGGTASAQNGMMPTNLNALRGLLGFNNGGIVGLANGGQLGAPLSRGGVTFGPATAAPPPAAIAAAPAPIAPVAAAPAAAWKPAWTPSAAAPAAGGIAALPAIKAPATYKAPKVQQAIWQPPAAAAPASTVGTGLKGSDFAKAILFGAASPDMLKQMTPQQYTDYRMMGMRTSTNSGGRGGSVHGDRQ